MARIPGSGLVRGMALTLTRFFQPKRTVMYPEAKPDIPPRNRGRLELVTDERALKYGAQFPARAIHAITSATPTGGSVFSKSAAILKLAIGTMQARSLIKRMGADKAIIFSTHILEEVDAVCDRAVIIDRGRVVSNGTPAELHSRSRHHNSVVVRVKSDALQKASKLLRGLPHVTAVETAAPSAVLLEFGVSVRSRQLRDSMRSTPRSASCLNGP